MLKTNIGLATLAASLLVGTPASKAATNMPTFTLRDAVSVIRIAPKKPASELPFKPSARGSADLHWMIQVYGECGSPASTPRAVCNRWSSGIRAANLLGAPQRYFSGRRTGVDDTAYVFKDDAGAKRAFPIIREIWTRGFFGLDVFTVHGLGTQSSGLVGAINLSQDNLAVGYLWRVGNVVFQLFWVHAKQPPGSQVASLAKDFRPYVGDVDRRAQSHG
jgi:hypothetical protein